MSSIICFMAVNTYFRVTESGPGIVEVTFPTTNQEKKIKISLGRKQICINKKHQSTTSFFLGLFLTWQAPHTNTVLAFLYAGSMPPPPPLWFLEDEVAFVETVVRPPPPPSPPSLGEVWLLSAPPGAFNVWRGSCATNARARSKDRKCWWTSRCKRRNENCFLINWFDQQMWLIGKNARVSRTAAPAQLCTIYDIWCHGNDWAAFAKILSVCVCFDSHYDSVGIPSGAMLSAPSHLFTCWGCD